MLVLVSSCAVIAGLDEKQKPPAETTGGSAGVGLEGAGGSAAGRSGGEAGSGDAGTTAAGTGTSFGGSAGASTGRGGSGATGGKGGGGGAGGKGGGAGAGVAGSAGGEPFPSYGILDDFNRPGPELGSSWIAAATSYSVLDQGLDCVGDYCAGTFWHEKFGVVQEAFVTLAHFDPEGGEINLVIKAQGDKDCDLMEILYLPAMERVEVIFCAGGYTNLGVLYVSFAPGDQLGARARADGHIEVFKNGARIGVFDATSYPFIDLPGYIGVNGFTGTGVTSNGWDDFGGGGE